MSRYLPALLVGALLGGGNWVSAQVNTGTISGVLQDAFCAAIAGGLVTVRNIDTGTTRTLVADSGDRYTAPDLPLGNDQHCQTWLRTHFEQRLGKPQCR